MEQLLATKFYIPSTRPELVTRPRLIERLNEGLYRKLTLISAPAGFGKTTLVTDWVGKFHLEAAGDDQAVDRIVWLSLDEADNEAVRFLIYFIAALNYHQSAEAEIGKGALSMLQSPQPPSTNDILISLINDLAIIPEKIIFVLDDYHLIEAQPIHQALVYLLENLPPQLHLVIATRQDPPLPLARLHARDQLTELRAADLRFSSQEAADFLNQVLSLNLSSQDIAELENRTEGWIAGLQLAALSIQGRKDPTSFIKSFTGSNRLVLDYLIEDVLNQQAKDIQVFLMQTAILNRLTGSLCDALTGHKDSQEILESLDHANLFIVRLDEERRWYRYHHLFADLLRQRLGRAQAEQLRVLNRKASEWHRRNGFVDEAIEHALQAEDFKQAAHLIVEQVDALWQRGEHGKLRRWVEVLPAEFLISEPQLGSIRAYYLHTIGQYEKGENLLQKIEKVLAAQSDPEIDDPLLKRSRLSKTERLKLQGRFSVIRALIYSFGGDVREMIQHADRALEVLPEGDITWRNLAAFALGDAHSYLGDMAESYNARSEAFRACKAAGNVYYTIIAGLKLALTLKEQGKLREALELCEDQIKQASEYSLTETTFAGCTKALWGEVLAELNDLEAAKHHAVQGVEISERGSNLVTLAMSYLSLMRVFFSSGDLECAENIIQKVSKLDREITVPPWLLGQMAAWQARIWLERDTLEVISDWESELGLFFNNENIALEDIEYFKLIEYIVYARVLIARGRLDEANRLLRQLDTAAEMGGRIGRLIEIKMLQALAFQSVGDTNQAMEWLKQALAHAEAGGFLRIFVDEGQEMGRLLYQALDNGIAPNYVQRLLATFSSEETEIDTPAVPQVSDAGYIEPLSEREIEVLQLIAEGLTNPEIASRLYLSMHTIKTHTRNIYGKLDVHNRTEAVAKARAVGVLLIA